MWRSTAPGVTAEVGLQLFIAAFSDAETEHLINI